jgi:NAD(P)-dependent dehydrogenase (short-subunit alcohol dehydrogenase family)
MKTVLTVDQSDMDLFYRASHDASPIHVSDLYARRTSFGQPVVYGVLGFLMAASRLPPQAGCVSEAVLEFPSPLFLGLDYASSWECLTGGKIRLRIEDGNRLALRSRLSLDATNPPLRATPSCESSAVPFARAEAASWTDEELRALPAVSGEYACEPLALAALEARFGLLERGFPAWTTACLLWTSQFVGMELPGTRALFSKLHIRFTGNDSAANPQLNYRVVTKEYDERFGKISLQAEIRTARGGVANAEIVCFVREVAICKWENTLDRGLSFAGKKVFVVGASRGLGAMIVRAFSLQGASVVFSYLKSREQADQLLDGAGAAVEAVCGDASDLRWCLDTAERIRSRYGHLDYLILNACPALNPISITEATATRITGYVSESTAMALYPFAALAPLLSESNGQAVFISSTVVESPIAEWPQYGMAKSALEHLFAAAATQYPGIRFHVVRPGRLRTDFSNTPMGRADATSPALEAKRLLDNLRDHEFCDQDVSTHKDIDALRTKLSEFSAEQTSLTDPVDTQK